MVQPQFLHVPCNVRWPHLSAFSQCLQLLQPLCTFPFRPLHPSRNDNGAITRREDPMSEPRRFNYAVTAHPPSSGEHHGFNPWSSPWPHGFKPWSSPWPHGFKPWSSPWPHGFKPRSSPWPHGFKPWSSPWLHGFKPYDWLDQSFSERVMSYELNLVLPFPYRNAPRHLAFLKPSPFYLQFWMVFCSISAMIAWVFAGIGGKRGEGGELTLSVRA